MGLMAKAAVGLLISAVSYALLRQVLFDLLVVQLHSVSSSNTGGKRVLITGSSRGVGESLAKVYAAAGANVVVHARSLSALEKVVQKCKSLGAGGVHAVAGDMSEAAAPARIVAEAAQRLGGLDVVVVNHVAPSEFSSLSATVASLRDGGMARGLQTNLLSYLLTAHAALPHLQRSAGSLVLVSSTAAQLPVPYCYEYCFSKRALAALHAGLRQELAINRSQVHVGIAHLGLIDTDSAVQAVPRYYKTEMPFASSERTARDIAAMPLARVSELVTPWYMRPLLLLRDVAAGHIEMHLRDISRGL